MTDNAEGWTKVLGAFDRWIDYETSEFGPWTGYFSEQSLRALTNAERLGWMRSMIERIIPGRVDVCRHVRVALEDFIPYVPGPEAVDTVRSMIDLSVLLESLMLRMSDIVAEMADAYDEGGLDEIRQYLSTLAETEEEIRHHMSLYSKGFGQLRSLGLETPGE